MEAELEDGLRSKAENRSQARVGKVDEILTSLYLRAKDEPQDIGSFEAIEAAKAQLLADLEQCMPVFLPTTDLGAVKANGKIRRFGQNIRALFGKGK